MADEDNTLQISSALLTRSSGPVEPRKYGQTVLKMEDLLAETVRVRADGRATPEPSEMRETEFPEKGVQQHRRGGQAATLGAMATAPSNPRKSSAHERRGRRRHRIVIAVVHFLRREPSADGRERRIKLWLTATSRYSHDRTRGRWPTADQWGDRGRKGNQNVFPQGRILQNTTTLRHPE